MMMTGLFTEVGHTRISHVLRVVIAASIALIGSIQLCGFSGLRYNSSPSLPVGLYITTTDAHANLVEFCPAEPFASLSVVRGYRSPGTCPDGAAPLLKPVVAKPGDIVDLSPRGICVNGLLLSNTAPLSQDTNGRPLKPWFFGRYVVAPNTIWVASSYHPRSFDSRYFGPLSTAAVRGHLKPFLTL